MVNGADPRKSQIVNRMDRIRGMNRIGIGRTRSSFIPVAVSPYFRRKATSLSCSSSLFLLILFSLRREE
jgi:hypothetical protein